MSLRDKETAALALITEQIASARRPVVLCSFGKDSLVLLHLCLRVRKVEVLCFRFARMPEKQAHALHVAQLWDLEIHDMWPTTVDEYQRDEFFEVFHGYQTGHESYIYLASGIRRRREHELRYLCAVSDLICRPRSFDHTYPWDVTFHGQKGTDDIEVASRAPITQPVSQLGATRVVVPFIDWTDADIWAYIRQYDLPYDRVRYDDRNEASSPDKFPTCYRCLDTTLKGQVVQCPKIAAPIQNVAKSASEHEQFRQGMIGRFQYCEASGEPRRTENSAHL